MKLGTYIVALGALVVVACNRQTSETPGATASGGIVASESRKADAGTLEAAPTDTSKLAPEKQAKEAAFLAFANRWRGRNGNFYTKVFHRFSKEDEAEKRVWTLVVKRAHLKQEIIELEKQSENWRVYPDARKRLILTRQVLDGIAGEIGFDEAPLRILSDAALKALEPKPKGDVSLLEVSGLSCQFSSKPLSDEDKQAGVTYRGMAAFWFKKHRSWTPWTDAGYRPDNEFAVAQEAEIGLGPFSSPEQSFQGHCLQLKIEQKDGHWLASTVDGNEFTDGKPTKMASYVRVALVCPKADLIEALLNPGDVMPWKNPPPLGKDSPMTPEESERSRAETLQLLRKLPL